MEKEKIKIHYRFEVLKSDIDRTKLKIFDCGYPNLNIFLNKEAINYHPYKFGTTTLVYDKNDLVGYYTLRNTSLLFSPSGNKSRCFPAIEIFRLAVDKSRQNKGIGSYIIKRIVSDASVYANSFSLAIAILVNSDPECKQFYIDNHFNKDISEFITCIYEPFNSQECVPMLLKLPVD